jgi:hypothetical protein
MRAALDEVMTKLPADQVTPEIKACMAESILKAAAEGQTTYGGLLRSVGPKSNDSLDADVIITKLFTSDRCRRSVSK